MEPELLVSMEPTTVIIPGNLEKFVDFSVVQLKTNTFCMNCGAGAIYMGKSKSKGFNKALCFDCANKYHQELNA